jgi:hypothetical protein
LKIKLGQHPDFVHQIRASGRTDWGWWIDPTDLGKFDHDRSLFSSLESWFIYGKSYPFMALIHSPFMAELFILIQVSIQMAELFILIKYSSYLWETIPLNSF